jgi:hypothetical protein
MADEEKAPEVSRARRGGRPKAQAPLGSLTIWVPAQLHDRLIQVAGRNGDSVSGLVRSHLVNAFLKRPTR